MHAVRADRRQPGLTLDLDAHAPPAPLMIDEQQGLLDHRAEIDGFDPALVLAHEAAQPGDDLSGANPLLGHPAERALDQRTLRPAAADHAQAPFGEAHDRGQGLVHLMHDPRAHLAELQQPRGMGRVFQAQPRLLLHLPAFGEVADDAGEQPPAGEAHLAHRKVGREDAAVLALRFDLAADADDPGFAGTQVTRDVAVVLFPVGRGHEHRDVASDQLVAGVSEHPLGGRVDRLDRAGLLDGDDRIDGGIEDRAQALPALRESLVFVHGRAPAATLAV